MVANGELEIFETYDKLLGVSCPDLGQKFPAFSLNAMRGVRPRGRGDRRGGGGCMPRVQAHATLAEHYTILQPGAKNPNFINSMHGWKADVIGSGECCGMCFPVCNIVCSC